MSAEGLAYVGNQRDNFIAGEPVVDPATGRIISFSRRSAGSTATARSIFAPARFRSFRGGCLCAQCDQQSRGQLARAITDELTGTSPLPEGGIRAAIRSRARSASHSTRTSDGLNRRAQSWRHSGEAWRREHPARLPSPYLLFLGRHDRARATPRPRLACAIGRRSDAWANLRFPSGSVSTGLPRLTPAEARARGARAMVIGVANSGGVHRADWIPALEQALEAGLDIVSGMHSRLADMPGHRRAGASGSAAS